MTTQNIIIQNRNVRFISWGDPEKPLIIGIHGLGGSACTFHEVAHQLMHDYHLVSIDLPGHGKSEDLDTDYSPDYLMPWLSQVIDTITKQPFYLLAHSYGASVALHFSAAYPDRVKKSILLDGGYHDPEYGYAYFTGLYEKGQLDYKPFMCFEDEKNYYIDDFDGYVFDDFEGAVQAELDNHTNLNPLKRTMIEDLIVERNGKFCWHANGTTAVKALNFQYNSQKTLAFERIMAKTKLIYADQPAEYYQSRIEQIAIFKSKFDVDCVLYENTGHMVHYDQPERLSDDIRAFFLV
ncbi:MULTISPECIES: alpha/beta fold hydrolase [unclassified Fusibacter]|uniref:alpha/beta fold hydrolase n=1 Tax=unclassified Fusibacter TaxID=2624464 RepID=UPI001012B2ED|nr:MULTISPECIES: alpha/beta hydrolase [unclassified Fusibacter]MCK8059599.1 alpha/beta hydrolase [Fusibacter sp. A2]NPE21400.1 alpha/beta hydrolase [Fusibacter sp. A1]RXV61815.1 alpha/beta hydrolase [Fusibacter sp. A1]